jgi:hypothetical protein
VGEVRKAGVKIRIQQQPLKLEGLAEASLRKLSTRVAALPSLP